MKTLSEGRILCHYFLALLLPLAIVLLGETDIIPNGMFLSKEYPTLTYLLNIINVVLLVISTVTAVRFPQWIMPRLPKFLSAHPSRPYWVRWAILICPMTYSLAIYFLTMDTTGTLCAAILLMVYFYCWPKLSSNTQ